MSELTPDKVCVLIPSYNEAQKITMVLRGVQAAGFTPVVADDGSVDDTAARTEALGIKVLRAATNQGKGASVRRGIRDFLKSNFEAVILMDSDGQHDPADLPKFLKPLSSGPGDLIIGNRMIAPAGMSRTRWLTNRFMSGILSSLAGQDIPDSQCGYRALTREVAQALSFRSDRFETESEMILEASRLGFKISSVPIRCIYAGERSRIRPWHDTFRFFSFLFRYLKQPS